MKKALAIRALTTVARDLLLRDWGSLVRYGLRCGIKSSA